MTATNWKTLQQLIRTGRDHCKECTGCQDEQQECAELARDIDELEEALKSDYTTYRRYGCYSEKADITFIMEETFLNEESIRLECIGWYFGEPDDNSNNEYGNRNMVLNS